MLFHQWKNALIPQVIMRVCVGDWNWRVAMAVEGYVIVMLGVPARRTAFFDLLAHAKPGPASVPAVVSPSPTASSPSSKTRWPPAPLASEMTQFPAYSSCREPIRQFI